MGIACEVEQLKASSFLRAQVLVGKEDQVWMEGPLRRRAGGPSCVLGFRPLNGLEMGSRGGWEMVSVKIWELKVLHVQRLAQLRYGTRSDLRHNMGSGASHEAGISVGQQIDLELIGVKRTSERGFSI